MQNSDNASVFSTEVNNSLLSLKESNQFLRKIFYFLSLGQKYFDEKNLAKRNPQVIVLGTSIPEEIIYACGAKPFWVLGGSLGTSVWADTFVPRDTDAISQSILGYIKNSYFNLAKNALIIIPIVNDSMRKIAYILAKDYNIITIDFPPDKNSNESAVKWISQMKRLSDTLQNHLHTNMTMEMLDIAVNNVNNARFECRRFIDNCKNNDAIISGVLSMYVLNTYYYSDDIIDWTTHLAELNNELEASCSRWKVPVYDKPNVLLMGSPVFFPNYKIPFLLNSLNLNITSYVSIDSQKIYTDSRLRTPAYWLDDYFNHVVLENYFCDCSSAYIDNFTMYNYLCERELEYKVDGVIYHVLKGQIEYDFELARYEYFFTSKGIPVFRLETDYNYHDIEQIRIRVEAFTEMLTQRLYKESRIAQ